MEMPSPLGPLNQQKQILQLDEPLQSSKISFKIVLPSVMIMISIALSLSPAGYDDMHRAECYFKLTDCSPPNDRFQEYDNNSTLLLLWIVH